MILRAGFVMLLALLTAVQVVRNAAVLALRERNPSAAAQIWKSNPNAVIPLAMIEIARSRSSMRFHYGRCSLTRRM